MSERWQAGEQITLRYVGIYDRRGDRPGRLFGWPYVVAADREDVLALWMPVGTHIRLVDMADRGRVLPDMIQGNHPFDEFRRGEVLRLMLPGRPYSIWLHWSPDAERRFLGWYVNLEAPFVRTAIGVDTCDNSLDLVVMPDFAWHWKDEHLTQHWIDVGVFTREETESFYAAGRKAVADAEARRFPFDGAFMDWRPDPAWGMPEVHPEWDRLAGYDLTLTTGRRLPWTDPPR